VSTKVNNPVTIDTTDGKKLCVKGKLVLIRNVVSATVHVKPDGKGYVPIIISQTENINEDEIVYHPEYGIGKSFYSKDNSLILISYKEVTLHKSFSNQSKILVIPNQFYISTIIRIEDGTFKDGDSIWVEVRPDRVEGTTHYAMGSFNWEVAINDVNKVSLYDVQ